MNKKFIMIILAILFLIVGVTAYLNSESIANKNLAQEEALVTLKENGNKVKTVDMKFVVKQGEVTFNKELDTSDSDPINHSYTGVPLINLLKSVGIKMKDKKQVIVKAVDGYTVALTVKEVFQKDNVYLVYSSDGNLLKGKKEGGTGPYRIIIKEDQFGQRGCKFVTEVNVK
jgi:hypothetical protein